MLPASHGRVAMPWNSRDFYKTIKNSIFLNADVTTGKRSYRQRLVQLQKQKRKAIGKLISLLGSTVTNKQFNKRLLGCRQLPTATTASRVHRCGTFICPFCFYRRLYLFFRGPFHRAIKNQKSKYVAVTCSQTFMLQCPDEGLFGTYLFDPSFIPPVQTRSDCEKMAARLFTEADLQRRYEQMWFTNDAINCQATEPVGGFSATWFDYHESKKMFVVNRVSLHLTNTNALSPPTAQALNTRVNFSWHFAADFDPSCLFTTFISFPYGLYSALLKTSKTEFGPANVVAYLFGMRRLLEKKFRFQQTWGCLHGRTSTA